MKFQLLILVTCLIFDGIIVSSKELPNQVPEDKEKSKEENEINLSYLGDRIYGVPTRESGDRVAEWNQNHTMNPEELGTYVEGDILFSNPTEKSAYASSYFRWPGGKIPYKIIGLFTSAQRQMIMDAINDFHIYTCLRFVPQTDEHPYIRITSFRTGCHSSVGHTGFTYNVNLQTPSCTAMKGTVIHELMHAAGFIHEQSRGDRDDHVSILWNNIDPDNIYNFYSYKKEDLNDFGVPYDYQSVMHYSRYAFTANGYQTIIPKPYHNHELGQRVGFSELDVEKVNRMYQCKKEGEIVRKEKKLTHPLKPISEKKKSSKRYLFCSSGRCWVIIYS